MSIAGKMLEAWCMINSNYQKVSGYTKHCKEELECTMKGQVAS
jgi:hypothetical protein